VCPAARINCGERCIDTTSDPEHCGACDSICQGGECISGACDCGDLASCDRLWGAPGTTCTDTLDDPLHCGACEAPCLLGRYCVGGACVCQPGLTPCAGACVNTAGDAGHCGGCAVPCGGGTPVCANGVCAADCPAGTTECADAWSATACADLESDPAHCGFCGNPCQVDEICVAGACAAWLPALGCDSCPCEGCAAVSECCPYPGDASLAICLTAAGCP